MPSLADNFNAARGDLVYGFETVRSDAIYTNTKLTDIVNSGAWIMANDFNNNTILNFSQYLDPSDKTVETTQKSNIMAKVEKTHKPEAALFLDGLYKKYPPSVVAKQASFTGEGNGGIAVERRNKMIRRSCKFGIENVIVYVTGNAKIHFLLGDLKADAATQRMEFNNKVPITISEIRFVFRNWTRFQHKLIFYDDSYDETKIAPWQSHPNEWTDYAKKRLAKIIGQAELYKPKPSAAIQKAKLALTNASSANVMAIVDAGNELRNKIGRPTEV